MTTNTRRPPMTEVVAAIQLSAFALKTAKEALPRIRSHHENVCEKVRSLVTDIADKGTAWKLLNQATITHTITEIESDLDHAYKIFKVSAHNQHNQLQQDFAIALRQDNQRIKLFLETLLHNHHQMLDTPQSVPKQQNSEATEEAPTRTSTWSIDESQIELCTTPNLLGSGEIGRVFAGNIGSRAIVKKQIHSEVAQKLLSNAKRRKILETRIESWTQMQHPHLAEFIGASLELSKVSYNLVSSLFVLTSLQPFFVVKFYPFGNVLDYLQSYPTRNRLSILHHAALGMQHLHSRNIIHANLKPGNLLVDSNHFVVITDYQIPQKRHSHAFSTSRPQGRYTYHRRSLPYVAPERFDNAELALAVDVYSFAMIGWEVCTGLVPFCQIDPAAFYETVVVQKTRPPKSDSIDATLWSSMQSWWADDPTIRPQFSAIETELRGLVDAKIHARQAKRKVSAGKRVRVDEAFLSARGPEGPRVNRARSLSPSAVSPTQVDAERPRNVSDVQSRNVSTPANLTHNRRPSKAERILGEVIPEHLTSQQPSTSSTVPDDGSTALTRRNTTGRTRPDNSSHRQSILVPLRRPPSGDRNTHADEPPPIIISPKPRRASISYNEMTPIVEVSANPSPSPPNNGPPVTWYLLPRPELDLQEISSRAITPPRRQLLDKLTRPVPPQPPNTPEPPGLAITVHKQVTITSEPAAELLQPWSVNGRDVPTNNAPPEPQLKPDKPPYFEPVLSPVRRQPTAVRQREMIMQALFPVQPALTPDPAPITIKADGQNTGRRNLPQPPGSATPGSSSTPERGLTPEPSQTILGRRGLPELPELPTPTMPAAGPVRVLTPDLPQVVLTARQDFVSGLPFPVMSATSLPERPLTPDMPQAILDMTPRRPSQKIQRIEVSDSARQAIAFSLHALMNPVTFHNLIRNILICYPDWLKNTKQNLNRNPHAPHVYKDRAKSHVITFETILTMTTWATGPSEGTDSAAGVNGCRTLIYVLAACSMAELAHRDRPGRPYLFVPKFVDKVMSKPAFQHTLEDLALDLWTNYGSKLSTSTQAVSELPSALEDCIEQLINDYAPLLA
ncbi:hypothetical protein CVT24_003317 [Panaeolus cyanescens]|uniref:Protein kinase domain-containing protein n=1 Tax=Panaeolus cyanescens TaxID=181874 RepID=A0A409Y6Q1_9AGAR|nr:hypothetical protein CVT24_003317 [Panaeolus cyanescens]